MPKTKYKKPQFSSKKIRLSLFVDEVSDLLSKGPISPGECCVDSGSMCRAWCFCSSGCYSENGECKC